MNFSYLTVTNMSMSDDDVSLTLTSNSNPRNTFTIQTSMPNFDLYLGQQFTCAIEDEDDDTVTKSTSGDTIYVYGKLVTANVGEQNGYAYSFIDVDDANACSYVIANLVAPRDAQTPTFFLGKMYAITFMPA